MSYILDALKRADAERSRGAVPGLHARQLPNAGNAAAPPLQNRVGLLMVAAGLLGALAFGLWAWRMPTEALGVPTPTSATVPIPATLAPVAPTANTLPLTLPATPQPLPPALPAQPPKVQAVGPKAAGNAMLTPPMNKNPATDAAATAAMAKTAAQSAAAAITAPVPLPLPLPLLSELPDALRRQIPALTITGTVYSDDPKQRLLLINNQVLPQGSQVAPEVLLEEIRQRSAVFNFRGTRFRTSH